MSESEIQSFEPVTQQTVDMIARSLGSIQSMVVHFGDVDVGKGCGVVSSSEKCLWTKDGRRISIAVLPHGGFIASLSKSVDPACPA